MRRTSVFLALAAILLTVVVGYTYWLRLKRLPRKLAPAPHVETGIEGLADRGWHYHRDDPQRGPEVHVDAKSYQATHDPSTFQIRGLALRLYSKTSSTYTFVTCDNALFDEGSGVLKSQGPVTLIIQVPSDKTPEDKAAVAKLVHIETSGITYETKSGKATTDQAATFGFPSGGGKAVGADYDPNTNTLHLKSQITLDWTGSGPEGRRFHIESGDLVYKEAEQKIYLSPWSKMQRQTTTIQAQNSVVTLDDGTLQKIDSDHPVGSDNRDDRQVDYSAEKMTALFDDAGDLTEIVADKNARVTSTQPTARTVLTGDQADLRFSVDARQENGQVVADSNLQRVTAVGHAVAVSEPLPTPGVLLGDTRILRSETIELEMKPGGQDVQEIQSPVQSQLEFKPNRPDQPHRILDATRLRVIYGEGSYVDTFLAWNVATHTDKPAKPKDEPHLEKAVEVKRVPPAVVAPPAPALTWSDEMVAKFKPNSNEIENIDQSGHFRYQEGLRKASAKRAVLEQSINRITLIDDARVLDDTGSTSADNIVMNQANGDMDAAGKVKSTHAPDKNQKPGTSMLDASKSMHGQADKMQTRDDNSQVSYQGKALIWQGANRISADQIDIARDEQSLHAKGNVMSELVDNKNDPTAPANGARATADAKIVATSAAGPLFTTVWAPDLVYHDDTRVALYTGGVKLVRDRMTVTGKQMQAFLSPKTENSNDSSLDHAIGDGNIVITEVLPGNRVRTGTGEHCEYYTKEDKVVLNGGAPEMVDSLKGVTRGRQLTFFSGDDRLFVEGEKKQAAFTKMKKK